MGLKPLRQRKNQISCRYTSLRGRRLARHFILVAFIMFAAAGARADGDGHHPAGLTASDWNGAYVGGHFGAAWGQSDWTANGAGGLLSNSGSLGLGNPFDFSAGTGSYFQGLRNVRLGLNYRLPGTGDDGLSARPAFAPPSSPDWSVHAQTTYLIQMDPDFRSPYVGPHSLIPGQQRETWDVTFYLGVRLWQGAELWIDPEIDQGFGLSDTFGVAGYPSGEAYKLGEAVPYARIPRYFVRDTINLGGASEKIDAGANKLSGTQTADRLVLTLGKFSITDVFDTNQYAHDPRADWMNWALVDTGTFDYASDAWGYTYGAAAEWYQGDWTLRAGLFDLSAEPGSTDLDPTFKQFQSVVELERRYRAWGQPGKVAVTGYLSSGRMGTYEAAIDVIRDHGPARRHYRRAPVSHSARRGHEYGTAGQ